MTFGTSFPLRQICAFVLFTVFGGHLAHGQEEFSPPDVVQIDKGWFWQGSNDLERSYAYEIDRNAYGSDISRRVRLYENEVDKWHIYLPAYDMMTTPVTNRQYAAFVADQGYKAPGITRKNWEAQGQVYRYEAVKKYFWNGNNPPSGREDHPVVLVSWRDAMAYAKWLSEKTGDEWVLPSEMFWEKAIRGSKGDFFPWGNIFDPSALNSAEGGVFDTTPVGKYRPGPFGLRDGAGQVWEWTTTSLKAGTRLVKGGAWDDRGCGVCRPAVRQSRPEYLRHFLIGFRLMRKINPKG